MTIEKYLVILLVENPNILGEVPTNLSPKELGQFLSGENWREIVRFCEGGSFDSFLEIVKWNGDRSQPYILRCIQLHLLAKVGM